MLKKVSSCLAVMLVAGATVLAGDVELDGSFVSADDGIHFEHDAGDNEEGLGINERLDGLRRGNQ